MKPITKDEEIEVEKLAKQYIEDNGHRKGQAYFNALHDVRSDLANFISGTKLDPFYSNVFDNSYRSAQMLFQFLKDIDFLKEYLLKTKKIQ